jgi:hypothetical protein
MERLLALFAQSTVKTHVTQHRRAGVKGFVEGEEDDGAGRELCARRAEGRSEGKGNTDKICVTVEIREGTLTYRARVIAQRRRRFWSWKCEM